LKAENECCTTSALDFFTATDRDRAKESPWRFPCLLPSKSLSLKSSHFFPLTKKNIHEVMPDRVPELTRRAVREFPHERVEVGLIRETQIIRNIYHPIVRAAPETTNYFLKPDHLDEVPGANTDLPQEMSFKRAFGNLEIVFNILNPHEAFMMPNVPYDIFRTQLGNFA
jgi:hypothetical protein